MTDGNGPDPAVDPLLGSRVVTTIMGGGAHEGDGSSTAQVREWKTRILNAALGMGFAILVMTEVVLLSQGEPGRATMFQLLPSVLISGGAFLWRSGPLHVRGYALVFAYWCGIGLVAMDRGFSVPNPWIGAMFVCVVAALVFDRIRALVVTAMTIGFAALVAVPWVSGRAFLEDGFADPADPGTWVRVLIIFSALLTATVAAVMFLVSKLESSLMRLDSLNDELRQSSEDERRARQQREVLQERLMQVQRMETAGRMAGGIAHDFNNLLHIVMVNSELLAEYPLALEQQDCLEDISLAAKQASSLTRQLLRLGESSSEKASKLELNTVLGEQVEMLRRMLPSGVRVRFEPDTEDRHVKASPSGIEKILTQLVNNASDAMGERGQITVSVTKERASGPGETSKRAFVVLCVEDDGAGMTPDSVRRAFDPFFTTKPLGGGAGLGLSLVHSLAKDTDGFVQLQSEIGEGTRVYVYLSEFDESVATAAQAPAGSREAAAGAVRVLIVDDEPSVRRAMAQFVEGHGYEPLEASNGSTALQAFRDDPNAFAAVITDAVMPNMSGRELCAALVSVDPYVPIMVCSGYTGNTFEREFFSGEHRAFLQKPFERAEFTRTLDQIVEAGAA